MKDDYNKKNSINYMKNSILIRRISCLIISITMLVCSCIPAFAVAENTEYENALKAGWGNSIGGYTNPSGYSTSWNMQVLRFLNSEYNSLGVLSSLLNDIHTETNYIPTINTALNNLKSGWGNWSSGYTYPSGYGSSWYRLIFEGINYISATIDNIENIVSTSGITDLSTNVAIIKNNTNNIISLPKIFDTVFANRGRPTNDISLSSNNTTPRFIKWYKNNTRSYYLFDSASVEKPQDYYGIFNNNLLGIASLLYGYNTSYTQNRYNGSGISTGTNDSISLADILYFGFEDNNKIIDYIASNFGHNISNITSSYINLNRTNTATWNSVGIFDISSTDILKPIYVKWRRNDNVGYGAIYGISDDIINASLSDYLAVINSNIVNSLTAVYAPNKQYRKSYINESDLSIQSNNAISLADMLNAINSDFTWFANRYSILFMDNDSLAAKQANKNQEQAVLTNFSGAGNSAPTVSNYNDVNSAVNSVKSGLNTNVQPSAMTNIFNSSDGIGWFSQSTMNSLDATTPTRSIADYHEEYYWDKYNELYSIVTRGIEE